MRMLSRIKDWMEKFAADELTPEEILELRAREGTFLDDFREAKEGAKQFVRELLEPPVVIADATWWMTEGLELSKIGSEIEGITVPEEVIRELERIREGEEKKPAGEALELIRELQREGRIRVSRAGVLETALKAADEGKEVVILSSDPVLRRKARTKDIPVLFSLEQLYGDEEIFYDNDPIYNNDPFKFLGGFFFDDDPLTRIDLGIDPPLLSDKD